MAENNRAYAAAHFALELDGKDGVGLFRSIEGGGVRADVMTYQNGANYDRWRQLGKPKFEDLKIQVGMAMSKPFYDWIEKFFEGNAERKTGAVVAADFYYKERARREFTNAMISEITFPKLDASDKNAAYMTVGISVEEMVFKKGTNEKLAQAAGFEHQKLWAACNFSLRLDGFESSTKRCSKIDTFSVKQKVIEHHVGGRRAPIKVPSPIDWPTIAFYVPEADIAPLQKHHKQRVIKGEVPGRLSGEIEAFDNERRSLLSLAFSGADILAITPDKSDATTEEIKTCKVEIYTENMKFTYKNVSAHTAS